MAEWLIEEGIGETRALLLENGNPLAARLSWPGELTSGQLVAARFTSKPTGARRGIATTEIGQEILVDHLPKELTEGAMVKLRISRAPIAEKGRFKRAQGRYADNDAMGGAAKGLSDEPRSFVHRFPTGLWEEVWMAASSGVMDFEHGQILACPTPAMTLIDIDGVDDPLRTAKAAVAVIARSIRWFDLGGSIGIDFPTLQAKADRKEIDGLIAANLAGWPHERTAMNGFGFVQIVARLEGPSLLHRFTSSRTGMCARFALRVAERAEGRGAVVELRVHPALKAKFRPEWIEELARRMGKQVRIETDPGLALEAPQAQIVER